MNNQIIYDDELHIAEKFINYYNRAHKRDFVLPYHPAKDDGIDALTHSESSPSEVLKIQIVRSDFKGRESLGKKDMSGRFREFKEFIEDTIIIPIRHKSSRYSKDFKRNVVLLLDGWWEVTQEDLDYSRTHTLGIMYFILKNSDFKEIWFVSMKSGGPIYRLWPWG